MGFRSLGLLLPWRRHAPTVPGVLLCTLGEQEKKEKEIRTRNVLDGSKKVVSMVIETVSQIIV